VVEEAAAPTATVATEAGSPDRGPAAPRSLGRAGPTEAAEPPNTCPARGGAEPPSKGLAGEAGSHGPVYFEATIVPSELGSGEHFQPELFELGGFGGDVGGGGGGAGYFGGGGGGGCTVATEELTTSCGVGGGGGGGGSAYVYPSATAAAGVNGGNSEPAGRIEITYTTPVAPSAPPPAPLVVAPTVAVVASSQIGNQLLQLVAPTACTASSALLSLKVQSVPHAGKRLASYKVTQVGFYIDGGLPEKVLVGKPGHRRRRTLDEPQFEARALPSTFEFLPSKIGAHTGSNTVVVEVVLTRHVGKGRHRRTLRVTKTLSSTFDVC